MRKRHIILTAAAIILAACSTEEVDKWSEETAFAHFTSLSTEPTNFTFAMEEDHVTEKTLDIPITLMAPKADRVRVVNVEVVRDAANSGTSYSFEPSVKVEAGATDATLKVTARRTANLKAETDTIVFAIRESDDFMPGLPDYRENTLVLFDGFLQPAWWDSSYNTKRAIGECNSLKLKVWYTVFGNFDDPRGGSSFWTGNEAVLALFKLDQYSLEHYGKAFKDLLPEDE